MGHIQIHHYIEFHPEIFKFRYILKLREIFTFIFKLFTCKRVGKMGLLKIYIFCNHLYINFQIADNIHFYTNS